MQQIEVTLQEIWQATRKTVHKNKKKYTRNIKHKDEKDNYYEN